MAAETGEPSEAVRKALRAQEALNEQTRIAKSEADEDKNPCGTGCIVGSVIGAIAILLTLAVTFIFQTR